MCAISSVLPSLGCVRHVLGGEHAGDAGLVLDDDLLVPHLRQLGRRPRAPARRCRRRAGSRRRCAPARWASACASTRGAPSGGRGGAGGLDEANVVAWWSPSSECGRGAQAAVCSARGPRDARRSGPSRPARRCRRACTPASLRPISTPASVATSVRSLLSPRWPMRNMRPLTLPRPVPSERSKRSWISWRSASASTPARRDHAGEHRRIARPGRRTGSAGPRRAPRRARLRPSAGGARTPCPGPRSSSMSSASRQAVQQVGVRRVRPVAVLVHLDDLVPGPERARQLRASSIASSALRRQRVEADARRQHQALLRAADR